MVAQDEVYWEEEPQPVKSDPEPTKEVVHEKVERIESTSRGVGGLAVGFICGIVTLICLFIPWCEGSLLTACPPSTGSGINLCTGSYYETGLVSGWTAITTPNYFDSSFPYPYFVLAGAIMMIVFALIAVMLALSTRSKAGKVTFGWLAIMSSLISSVASIWAMLTLSNMTYPYGHGSEASYGVQSGIILCAVCSVIGLIAFTIALAGFNKAEKHVQQHGESSEAF
jgi:hypothetical protein